MIDYDKIAVAYQATDEKADKRYSILPTVLQLAGDLTCKSVLDLGCGSGFFARAFAKARAKRVYGVDISARMLSLALERPLERVMYLKGDIFVDSLPKTDLTAAPFVLNYALNAGTLHQLIQNIWCSLEPGGTLIGVVDEPSGRDLSRFGAKKSVDGRLRDGKKITIQPYIGEAPGPLLESYYYSRATINKTLQRVGFTGIDWHQPMVSREGYLRYGYRFWERYLEDPELGYFTALKA